MKKECSLCDLEVGERAVVERLETAGSMRRRLLDIGLCQGAVVECVGKSPMGDPHAYLIRGAIIAIRSYDSRTVIVKTERRCCNET